MARNLGGHSRFRSDPPVCVASRRRRTRPPVTLRKTPTSTPFVLVASVPPSVKLFWPVKSVGASSMIDYWIEQLKDAPALTLPNVRPRCAERTNDRASYRFQVRNDVAERLRQLAADEHSTLFVTVLAAYLVLLYRYSGQTDILVGTPGETVLFRTDVSGDPTFRELMRRAFDV